MRWVVALFVVSWISSLQVVNNYPEGEQQQTSPQQPLDQFTPDNNNNTSHVKGELIKASTLLIDSKEHQTAAHSSKNSKNSDTVVVDTYVSTIGDDRKNSGTVVTDTYVSTISNDSSNVAANVNVPDIMKFELEDHNAEVHGIKSPSFPLVEVVLTELRVESVAQVAGRFANESMSVNFLKGVGSDFTGSTVSPDDTVFTIFFIASMLVTLTISSAVLSGQKRELRRLRLYRLAEHV